MRGYLLLIAMTVFSCHTVTAQTTADMSLDDCLKYAERNQVKIKNAILDYQSALAKNKEVTGKAYPQLTAQGGLNYSPLVAAFQVPNFIKSIIAGDGSMPGLVKDSALNQQMVQGMPNEMSLAFQPKWSTNGTLQVSQLLFNPDLTIALKARSTLEELASKIKDLTIQDVKVSVSKSYYNILIAEKQHELINKNIDRLSQIESETKEIYKAGYVEKIDIDRITVTLTNLKTQQIKVSQMIELAYLALKFQIGMPLEEPLHLTDTLSEGLLSGSLLQEELDFNTRKEFQLLEVQNRLYNMDVTRMKMAWLPTLNFFGNYGYTLYNMSKLYAPGDNWQRSAMLGLSLNMPLFTGFQRKYQLRQSQITLEKNKNAMENLKMALTLEKQNASIALKNNVLALASQKQNMQLAEEVYNTTRIKYKEGVGSNLEVMNAEASLKEAQTNYFSALYDAITSKVDLEKALGHIQ